MPGSMNRRANSKYVRALRTMKETTGTVSEISKDKNQIILKGAIIARGTVDQLRALAGGDGSGDDAELTSVFLKLTGGSGLQEIDEIV